MTGNYYVEWGYPKKKKRKKFSNLTSAKSFAEWGASKLVYVRLIYPDGKMYKVKNW
jgi:hypothetical protein